MAKAQPENYLQSGFSSALEDIRNRVLAMGGLVEEQIGDAMTALLDQDSALGEAVVRRDVEVNQQEVSIDEQCSQIMAQGPMAENELRLVTAVIKTITDLERIGDEAEKIGFLAARLASSESPHVRYRKIQQIAELARKLVHESLHAFARMDPESAIALAHRDQEIDNEYEALMRQLITFMMEDPRSIREMLDVMWVARALERIGDHAKNICEYVVYLVYGKDIRHTGVQIGTGLNEPESRPGRSR